MSNQQQAGEPAPQGASREQGPELSLASTSSLAVDPESDALFVSFVCFVVNLTAWAVTNS